VFKIFRLFVLLSSVCLFFYAQILVFDVMIVNIMVASGGMNLYCDL
jgi:hypothetical protein